MWLLKYNTWYSLFYENVEANSYFRESYDVYVDDKLVIKDNTTNTFSLYFSKLGTINVKVISNELEYREQVVLKDDNYFIDVSNYLQDTDYRFNLTSKLQAIIHSAPRQSTIYFPKAQYKITNLFLKSDLKIVFENDVMFDVETNPNLFPIIPDLVENKSFSKEEVLSTWEGNPQYGYASIFSGFDLENVEIIGKGLIKANSNSDNWWHEPKTFKRAWRPKTIYLKNCSNVIVHGLSIFNSPSWTVHPFYSDNLKFLDMYINNSKESPNTDGINPESCSNVEINGCYFNLGDDCIAIKSGKVYMSKNHYKPSSKIQILNCRMEHGHGAIVLGSEIACGVNSLEIKNCFFNDTDRGLRVKTRRGRGEKSVIDDVLFKNITMKDVRAPITINSFYKCDPDGESDYVASEKPIAPKEEVPILGNFYFENLSCSNVHQVICMAYGLPEAPIKKIEVTNSTFAFAKSAEIGIPLMMRNEIEQVNTLFNLLNVDCFVVNNNKFSSGRKLKKSFTNVNVVRDENNEYCK